MKKGYLTFVFSLCFCCIFFVNEKAYSTDPPRPTLIINDGATLQLNSATLTLSNCLDIYLKSGGTFDLETGVLTGSAQFYELSPFGTFNQTSATNNLVRCDTNDFQWLLFYPELLYNYTHYPF